VATIFDFIGDESCHERYLAKIMHWEYSEDEQKGSCYDFIARDGAKIEAKFDWDSIKTGNHYLEFAQTSVNGETWVPSGFALLLKKLISGLSSMRNTSGHSELKH